MSWLALVESPDHVCVRYRITPFAEAFHNQTGPLGIKEIPKGIFGRIRLASGLKGSQLILQRKLLPVWQTQWLRNRVKNLVFDFDDAVFLRDSYHPKGFYDRKRLSRFQAVMETADAVVAGNQYLAERASEFRKNTRTYIIPTCINPSLYPPNTRTRRPGTPFYLAWIGSSSTLQGVEAQATTWNLVGREVGDSILRVICDRFPKFDFIQVDEKPWSKATEAYDLSSSDVGISWIPDDPWSKGKCGLKVLQYMAAGLPVIANPVGVHLEMITPGVHGFLCTKPQEWVDSIRWLRDHPKKSWEMGQAGRALIEEKYSITAGFQTWSKVLSDIEKKSAT